MKRDFELIRLILADIEKVPAGKTYKGFENIKNYDIDTIRAHVELLIEAGLVKGSVLPSSRSKGSISILSVERLTWDGHDFLGATRDETVWNEAREIVLKPATSMTYDILFQWLKVQASEIIGLS